MVKNQFNRMPFPLLVECPPFIYPPFFQIPSASAVSTAAWPST